MDDLPLSTLSLVISSYVRIPIAGYYSVTGVLDSTHATLQNIGDPFNAISGTTVTSGAPLLPAQAVSGAGGGSPGQNAYTNLTSGFSVPNVGATVSIAVASTSWMGGSGYGMFITGAGYYLVSSITDSTHAVVINSGSAANQPVGTSVPGGGIISAAGPQGPAGSSGTSLSAYDSLTSGFAMPSVGVNATMAIGNTGWLSAGQIIYVASAGYFQVATIVNATNFTATNLNYPGNATAGTSIASSAKVSPGGLQGPQGAGGPGLNAFTTLLSNYTQPAINANVTINVGTTAWMAIGQGIFVQGGGYYTVSSIADLAHAVVTSLGGSSSAPGSIVVGNGTQSVSPAGVSGTAGASSFTTLFTGFTQPSSGATTTVNVGATAWMAQGQILYIPGAGYYSVSSVTDATHVVLSNLGYTGNASTGSSIASGAAVVAAGLQGVPGPQGATGPTGSGVPQENLGAHLEAPTAKTYTVDVAASSAYTIRAVKAILGTGSLTLALNQNGSAISGAGSIAVTTTLSSTTLSQAVALNDKIQIVLSALTSSPADLQFSMWIQR